MANRVISTALASAARGSNRRSGLQRPSTTPLSNLRVGPTGAGARKNWSKSDRMVPDPEVLRTEGQLVDMAKKWGWPVKSTWLAHREMTKFTEGQARRGLSTMIAVSRR